MLRELWSGFVGALRCAVEYSIPVAIGVMLAFALFGNPPSEAESLHDHESTEARSSAH